MKSYYLFFVSFFGGIFIGGLLFSLRCDSVLCGFDGEKVEIKGEVVDVDRRMEVSILAVEVEIVCIEGVCVEIESERVRVKANRYPEVFYGDVVNVTGKLVRPESSDDFNYQGFLVKQGIYMEMPFANLEIVESGEGNLLLLNLFKMSRSFEERLKVMLPEPHASFMAGLLVGSRKGIAAEVMDDFQKTGLTHIIAISGYNITILILFVGRIFAWAGRRWQVVISGGLIFLFALFVGASAAVVRAAIMGVLGLLALSVGRKNGVILLVAWSGFLMALYNPLLVVFDIGFQLSFLAVLSLILVMPVFEGRFEFVPEFGGVREAFVSTLAAQVLVVPVILIYFGQISLVSPLANVAVVPWIPLVMLLGFLMVVFSYISGIVAWVFQAFVWLILKIMLVTTKLFALFPWAAIEIEWFNWLVAAGYYVLLWVCLRRFSEKLAD